MDPLNQLIETITELEELRDKLSKANDKENLDFIIEVLKELNVFKVSVNECRMLYAYIELEREKNDDALEQLRAIVALNSQPIELDLDFKIEALNKSFVKKWKY